MDQWVLEERPVWQPPASENRARDPSTQSHPPITTGRADALCIRSHKGTAVPGQAGQLPAPSRRLGARGEGSENASAGAQICDLHESKGAFVRGGYLIIVVRGP